MDKLPYLPKEKQEAILDGPAHPPPPGIVPNFENPPNNNAVAHVAIAICTALTTFCFLVRMYARIFKEKKLEIEDGLMVVGYGFFVALIYYSYDMMYFMGFFVHQWDITLRDLQGLQFILHLGGTFYSVTLPCLKAAILLEWTRIFVPFGARNVFFWVCHGMVGLQIMFLIGSVVALQLGCRPINKTWDLTVAGECFDKPKLEVASAGLSLAFDVVLLLIPLRIIWGLQMKLKKKIGVSILFSVGVLACVSAAFRLGVTVYYSSQTDVVYNVSAVVLWAIAEMTCGFLVLCVPSIPKTFKDTGIHTKIAATLRSLTSFRTSSMKSSGHKTGSHNLSKSANVNDSYVQIIDKNGMPMQDMTPSESTEQLQGPNLEGGIVRTTQFSTTSEEYPGYKGGKRFDNQPPWSNRR